MGARNMTLMVGNGDNSDRNVRIYSALLFSADKFAMYRRLTPSIRRLRPQRNSEPPAETSCFATSLLLLHA